MVALRNANFSKRSGRSGGGGSRGGRGQRSSDNNLLNGARAATDQVKNTAVELTRAVGETLREEASRLFDDQRERGAKRIVRTSRLARQAAHALHAVKLAAPAEYAEAAADQIERAADYLTHRDLDEILNDAGDVARRHPALVTGCLLVAGFAAARFLKASASRDANEDDDDDDREEGDGGR